MPEKLKENEICIDSIGLSKKSSVTLNELGYVFLHDFEGIFFPKLFEHLSFEQSKNLLKELKRNEIEFHFDRPDWTEEEWHEFIDSLIAKGMVTWEEVAVVTCGALNPPQVGTAIASNKSFQEKFPPRQTMKNVMAWFYEQKGVCEDCGTRLSLEADHIRSKQDFIEAGEDPKDADTLDNLQLLCKRCNVIKRPSHELGGIAYSGECEHRFRFIVNT